MTTDIDPNILKEGSDRFFPEDLLEESEEYSEKPWKIYGLFRSWYSARPIEELTYLETDSILLGDLIDIVEQKERDEGNTEFNRHSSYVRFYDNHVEPLEEAGIIESINHEEEGRTIKKGKNFEIGRKFAGTDKVIMDNEPGDKSRDTGNEKNRFGIPRIDLYESLSNRRRYGLIIILDEIEDELEKSEASRMIYGWERGLKPKNVTVTEAKTVYSSLHQHHLDQLQENDIVKRDGDRNLIQKGEKYPLAIEFADLNRFVNRGR